MFSKLAVRNVRRSFRDYGVYLLTLTFGVCLFYTFNSIDGQAVMVYLAQNGNPAVETIMILMDVLSVFVAAVLACLILYADRFLLRRRKRELGTYLLLGLSHGQVARVLFLETGLIGLVSLGAGLALGTLASLGLSALTLSMFQMDLSQMLALTFSPRAAGSGPLRLPPCRAVLLPGESGGAPGELRAASAVSYGLSPRDSLTLSSREGERLWCALQRELVTLDGAVVERQEFPVLPPPGLEPLSALAAAGALLLLGVPPERLRM